MRPPSVPPTTPNLVPAADELERQLGLSPSDHVDPEVDDSEGDAEVEIDDAGDGVQPSVTSSEERVRHWEQILAEAREGDIEGLLEILEAERKAYRKLERRLVRVEENRNDLREQAGRLAEEYAERAREMDGYEMARVQHLMDNGFDVQRNKFTSLPPDLRRQYQRIPTPGVKAEDKSEEEADLLMFAPDFTAPPKRAPTPHPAKSRKSTAPPPMTHAKHLGQPKASSTPMVGLLDHIGRRQTDLLQQFPALAPDAVTSPGRTRGSMGGYSHHGPKVKVPPTFSGALSELSGFLRAVRLYIKLQPHAFRDEEAKCLFALSYIEGPPAGPWADQQTADIIEGELQYRTYEEFEDVLRKTFGDPDENETARYEMEQLFQGDTPYPMFLAKFRSLAFKTEHSESSLLYHFKRGLHPDIRNVINNWQTKPVDLDGWYQAAQAVDIDQTNKDRQRSAFLRSKGTTSLTRTPRPTTGTTPGPFRPFPTAPRAPSSSRQTTPIRTATVAQATPNATSGPPHSLPKAGPPKPNSGCYRCGSSDHLKRNCPKNQAKVRLVDIANDLAGIARRMRELQEYSEDEEEETSEVEAEEEADFMRGRQEKA